MRRLCSTSAQTRSGYSTLSAISKEHDSFFQAHQKSVKFAAVVATGRAIAAASNSEERRILARRRVRVCIARQFFRKAVLLVEVIQPGACVATA